MNFGSYNPEEPLKSYHYVLVIQVYEIAKFDFDTVFQYGANSIRRLVQGGIFGDEFEI